MSLLVTDLSIGKDKTDHFVQIPDFSKKQSVCRIPDRCGLALCTRARQENDAIRQAARFVVCQLLQGSLFLVLDRVLALSSETTAKSFLPFEDSHTSKFKESCDACCGPGEMSPIPASLHNCSHLGVMVCVPVKQPVLFSLR